MGFLDSFRDFLSLLFSKDPAGSRDRRELREIRSRLKSVKPPIYKSSGNLLLPGFAASVYELAFALQSAREVLSRSVLAQDSRLARHFRDFLVERRLSEGGRRLLDSCNYEALKARIASSADPDTELAAAEADFRLVMKELDDPSFRGADAELAEFERLVDLCRYDFGRLLSAFDTAADPDSSSYKPKFSPVDGSSMAGSLADFYSVAADMRVTPSAVADLTAIMERLGGEAATDAGRRAAKSAALANKLLSSVLSSATMLSLLRAVRSESAFRPPKIEALPSALNDYRERRQRRWVEDRDRLLRELKESSLSAETVSLFGTPPSGGVLTLTGYDDELNRRLQAEASRSFVWLTPLRFLKTFERRYLSQGLIEASRRLAVEGFFDNGVLRARLTDAVGKLEKSGARITAFEESAGGRTRIGAAALRSALDEAAKGRDHTDAVSRITAALDARAKELVEQDVKSLRELAESIYDVIADFRKPTPELVTNIKTLAAAKDKTLIPTLANGYNATARFLKLMKAFLIVVPMRTDGESLQAQSR
jgi:hypothetical protein